MSFAQGKHNYLNKNKFVTNITIYILLKKCFTNNRLRDIIQLNYSDKIYLIDILLRCYL